MVPGLVGGRLCQGSVLGELGWRAMLEVWWVAEALLGSVHFVPWCFSFQ